jgi:uracil-DNA glycosylase
MHDSWKKALAPERDKPYFKKLLEALKKEREEHVVFPQKDQVFTALKMTPLDDVKVVILGQDPYHNYGQAHGLAFSVPVGTPIPPSLANIHKELEDDIGCPRPNHGNLECWATQGVLLLNTTLTVRAHEAGSHADFGWEKFTGRIVELLANQGHPVVFILWGRHARSKARVIDVNDNYIIESAHPSPLSAHNGFFGSKPFSKANEGLDFMGVDRIDWGIK